MSKFTVNELTTTLTILCPEHSKKEWAESHKNPKIPFYLEGWYVDLDDGSKIKITVEKIKGPVD